MKRAIYPQLDITYIGNEVTVITSRRVKIGKYWYLWDFVKKGVYEVNNFDIIGVINAVHSDVYHSIVLGKASLKLVDGDGRPIFIRDTDQRSEEDRISELLLRFKL